MPADIHNTLIFTDGSNLFAKPKTFAQKQLDSFLEGDERWTKTNVVIGESRIYFDTYTLNEDEAWIICSGPTQVTEEKLRQIIDQERLSIWKPRSLGEWVEFILD
jgi:hypothetical protein